jgi:hypothetical protein
MRHFFCRHAPLVAAMALMCLSGGCSVYMEATRPTPIALDDYQIGQSRDSVLERLGAPENIAKESDGASCDFYRLYTRGYGAGGKIPLAVAEGAADFFTLGLAEIVLTPTEGVTKNEKHPVAICYKDDRIARINTDTGPSAGSAETAINNAPAASPAAAATPAQATASAASSDTAGPNVADAAPAGPNTASQAVAVSAANAGDAPKTDSSATSPK